MASILLSVIENVYYFTDACEPAILPSLQHLYPVSLLFLFAHRLQSKINLIASTYLII